MLYKTKTQLRVFLIDISLFLQNTKFLHFPIFIFLYFGRTFFQAHLLFGNIKGEVKIEGEVRMKGEAKIKCEAKVNIVRRHRKMRKVYVCVAERYDLFDSSDAEGSTADGSNGVSDHAWRHQASAVCGADSHTDLSFLEHNMAAFIPGCADPFIDAGLITLAHRALSRPTACSKQVRCVFDGAPSLEYMQLTGFVELDVFAGGGFDVGRVHTDCEHVATLLQASLQALRDFVVEDPGYSNLPEDDFAEALAASAVSVIDFEWCKLACNAADKDGVVFFGGYRFPFRPCVHSKEGDEDCKYCKAAGTDFQRMTGGLHSSSRLLIPLRAIARLMMPMKR